jgi:DNA mismatch repair protein MutS2
MSDKYSGLQFSEVKRQMIRFCSFSLGQQIIQNAEPVFYRLPVITELNRVRQAIECMVKYGSMPFGGVRDISYSVSLALRDSTLTAADLLTVADHSYAVKAIKAYIKSCQNETDALRELTDTLETLEKCADEITRCISRSGEINDNASAELARLRRQKIRTQASISGKLAEFISRNAHLLQEDIVAQRNGRSVVLIKNTYKNSVNGLQYGTSSSGAATYIEPAVIVTLNNELQLLQEAENREIQRILFNLSQLVKKDGSQYLANNETLGMLDSIFAKAQWAREKDAIVAETSSNMNLIIEKGRHPLIDPEKVVANSYHIIDPIRTILITGPNTGGKTVSLKLIGLFTVMHLSGMPLPCREASIPLYDNIFYDIGDNQSIQDDLSTFSAHIKKLAWICRKATNRSLVIVDELGSGTDPVEGQALASAVLEYFRRNQIYTVATTHFAKLKAYGQQYDDILMASVEFDQQNLKPTYRYLENTVGQSNAIEIARRYGFDEEILQNAYDFKLAQQAPEDIVMENLQKQLETVSQEREYLEQQIAELQKDREAFENEKDKFDRSRQEEFDKAREEASEIVEKARQEAEEIIEELKQQKNYDLNRVATIKHQLSELAQEEDDAFDDPDRNFKVGDYVRITLTNQHGEIISIDRKGATVLCNGIRIKSSLNNLVKTNRPKPKAEAVVRNKAARSVSFKVELNLIGMTVEEAMPQLDKFLDSALLAKAPFVRVVHGMGTGALRKAVWDRLKKCSFVSKYEFAPSNQGGSGATIVTLKE